MYRPPPDLGLEVLHEDAAMLLINKPAGLLSVPGRGEEKQDSLTSRVQKRFADALSVHRLDMETSGIIVFARSPETHRTLSIAFQERLTDKRYVAVVDGLLTNDAGEIDLPLITDWPNRPLQKVDHDIGKPSLTRYEVLQRDERMLATRVSLEPVTGRSHQLRVHLKAIGHAILGDALYADETALAKAPRLLLHATDLSLPHPITGERLQFHCPAPF